MSNNTVTYSQVNETAADFLANVTYDVLKPEESFICDYMQRETDYDKAKPSGIKVFLPAGELSVRDGYTNITYRETVEEGDCKFVNLTPGAVSEYTVTSGGKTVASGTLKPTGAIRMIDCGDTVFNVRDLGGWKCDGGSIKYGKLFRGGAFEKPEEARKILVDRCGIRAELNLRGIEDCPGNVSVLGEDILYCRPENCQFYTTSGSEIWREILRFVFDCVKGGNPLYFHCQCGADRTGTCACILEAILGVSRSDIDKDYELTNFAPDSSGRLRNYRDTWGGLMYEIYSELSCGVSIRDRVIRWVASLGFTEDEINDFRRSMTDGNPETIRLDELDKIEKTEYDQMNPVASEFLRDVEYDPAEHDTTRIIEYAERKTDYRKDHPVGVTVHTDGGFLKVHDRYDNRWYGEEVPSGDVRIVNLTPGVDSEYTVEREGKTVQYGVLHPTGSLRMIDCGDAVENVRDIGGWKCDGGSVKYGKIYRGGNFDKPEEARKILIDRCGIKAELNLKGIEESPYNVSLLGADILYCRPVNCQWYTIGDAEIWREILRFVFDRVKDGKPLYFHCHSGADRTGTCACVLEAILGLSLSDIEKDYELTNLAFEEHTRLRTMRGEYNWEWLLIEASRLPGNTFSERVVNWVASIGFTEDEINEFRRIMIDGTPEPVVITKIN